MIGLEVQLPSTSAGADDDVLQAVTGQQPFGMGQEAVEVALKAIKGSLVEKVITVPGIQLTRDKPDDIKRHKAKLEAK